MAEFEEAAQIKLDEYGYQFHLAMLNYGLDEETFNLHSHGLTTLDSSLHQAILPWELVEPVPDLRDYVKDMKSEYIKIFGDPDDPEFQKKIAETVAFLERGPVFTQERSI